MTMPHRNWPRISSSLFYQDAASAIDWICEAFGFEIRLKVEGEAGRIEHSELVYGDGLIMVGSAGGLREDYDRAHFASPQMLEGANTQALCVYVDDVDAHCEKARAAGATIFREPKTDDYGEEYDSHRTYGAVDPEGHCWWFMRVVRDAKTQ